MADHFPARELRVTSQVWSYEDNANTVTFEWIPGFSQPNEDPINTQFLDITLFPFDYDCSQPARICADVGPTARSATIRGIGPNAQHGWRINTNFLIFGGQPGENVWQESENQLFTSAPEVAGPPDPTPEPTPTPTTPSTGSSNTNYSFLIPHMPGYSVVVGGGGGVVTNPPTTTVSAENVARVALVYWSNRDDAITATAIAGAESSYNSAAKWTDGNAGIFTRENCNGNVSTGLWQIEFMHQDLIINRSGINVICSQEPWLQNALNNGRIARDLYDRRLSIGQTWEDWAVYTQINPSTGDYYYRAYIAEATAAVDAVR